MSQQKILTRYLTLTAYLAAILLVLIVSSLLIIYLKNETYTLVTIFIGTILISNLLAKIFTLLFIDN